jgi:hypothetical protein
MSATASGSRFLHFGPSLFIAVSSVVAVRGAFIAPYCCFSAWLPSHASIKHSDSRGGGSCSHVFWLDLCGQGANDRGSYLLRERKGVEKGEVLADRGEVVLFVEESKSRGALVMGEVGDERLSTSRHDVANHRSTTRPLSRRHSRTEPDTSLFSVGLQLTRTIQIWILFST